MSGQAPRFSRTTGLALALAAASALALSGAVLGEEADVLPAGPKQVLSVLAGDDPAALLATLDRQQAAEDWRQDFAERVGDAAALQALADYLALNAPFGEGAAVAAVADLPSDGKELFYGSCLSCHGGDSYFLKQDKSFEDWMGIFDAPYHRRLLTAGVERETFASYAAAATPVAVEAVPEALQDRR